MLQGVDNMFPETGMRSVSMKSALRRAFASVLPRATPNPNRATVVYFREFANVTEGELNSATQCSGVVMNGMRISD